MELLFWIADYILNFMTQLSRPEMNAGTYVTEGMFWLV